MSFKEFLDFRLFTWNEDVVQVENIFFASIVILVAPLCFFLFKKIFLNKYFKIKKISAGRAYAANQLIKYFVYIISLFIAINVLGISISGLWAAGAALLVGIGLGLQQTFNDFASGIILLLEGTVEKGDWIQVGDTVGEVKRIGLRTSLITTKRNISIIVPNSKITVDNVINLSHDNITVRHIISVGVAYGSDLALVKKVMLKCAHRHNKVLPNAVVRFVNFGDSSLEFELLFWSHEHLNIEDVSSDLRFMIDSTFKKYNISVPFPQQDLYIKSMPKEFDEDSKKTKDQIVYEDLKDTE